LSSFIDNKGKAFVPKGSAFAAAVAAVTAANKVQPQLGQCMPDSTDGDIPCFCVK
jgi:hypothetical protein